MVCVDNRARHLPDGRGAPGSNPRYPFTICSQMVTHHAARHSNKWFELTPLIRKLVSRLYSVTLKDVLDDGRDESGFFGRIVLCWQVTAKASTIVRYRKAACSHLLRVFYL